MNCKLVDNSLSVVAPRPRICPSPSASRLVAGLAPPERSRPPAQPKASNPAHQRRPPPPSKTGPAGACRLALILRVNCQVHWTELPGPLGRPQPRDYPRRLGGDGTALSCGLDDVWLRRRLPRAPVADGHWRQAMAWARVLSHHDTGWAFEVRACVVLWARQMRDDVAAPVPAGAVMN